MDWSSDVCASDLQRSRVRRPVGGGLDQQGVLALAGTFEQRGRHRGPGSGSGSGYGGADPPTQAYSASSPPSSSPLSPFSSFPAGWTWRSEEHTSELQSLMRISYAVFCLKKKKKEFEEPIKDREQRREEGTRVGK